MQNHPNGKHYEQTVNITDKGLTILHFEFIKTGYAGEQKNQDEKERKKTRRTPSGCVLQKNRCRRVENARQSATASM